MPSDCDCTYLISIEYNTSTVDCLKKAIKRTSEVQSCHGIKALDVNSVHRLTLTTRKLYAFSRLSS
jgi:hypothetical protein